MKKITLLFVLLISLNSFAQDEPENEVFKRDITKNELSINAFNLVAFGALDIAYERILTNNSSFAIEGFILALDRESEDAPSVYSKDASLTGKYKYFFGNRTAWGFYVNGLAMISSGTYNVTTERIVNNNFFYTTEEKDYVDFALGFGLGGKFVSQQGFFLDLSTGIGRNLFNSNSPVVVGQFNVNLGFRF